MTLRDYLQATTNESELRHVINVIQHQHRLSGRGRRQLLRDAREWRKSFVVEVPEASEPPLAEGEQATT